MGFPRQGVTQFLGYTGIASSAVAFAGGLLVLQFAAGGDGVLGTVFQIGDEGLGFLQGMKDIATTWRGGHGQFLPSLQAAAAVADDGIWVKAPLAQFQ